MVEKIFFVAVGKFDYFVVSLYNVQYNHDNITKINIDAFINIRFHNNCYKNLNCSYICKYNVFIIENKINDFLQLLIIGIT